MSNGAYKQKFVYKPHYVFKEVVLSQMHSWPKIKNALWIFAVSIKRGKSLNPQQTPGFI
jgi:hypothetical protein